MSNQQENNAFEASEEIQSFCLKAKNYAEDSENKIHGEDAARHGFRGGLVPGIGIYAYMTRAVVGRLGGDWIARGWGDARFLRPVYDGEDIRVRLLQSGENRLVSEVLGAAGDLRARMFAGLDASDSPPVSGDFPVRPAPRREDRPEASVACWPAGAPLGELKLTLDLDLAARTFVADVLDPSPFYAGSLAVAHPALLLAQANFILRDNMALGSWIHTASRIVHFRPARHGETLSLRGAIADSFERKGHHYVTARLAMFAGMLGAIPDRPVARIDHTAIIRLRGD